jgi:hypothetical protein
MHESEDTAAMTALLDENFSNWKRCEERSTGENNPKAKNEMDPFRGNSTELWVFDATKPI